MDFYQREGGSNRSAPEKPPDNQFENKSVSQRKFTASASNVGDDKLSSLGQNSPALTQWATQAAASRILQLYQLNCIKVCAFGPLSRLFL